MSSLLDASPLRYPPYMLPSHAAWTLERSGLGGGACGPAQRRNLLCSVPCTCLTLVPRIPSSCRPGRDVDGSARPGCSPRSGAANPLSRVFWGISFGFRIVAQHSWCLDLATERLPKQGNPSLTSVHAAGLPEESLAF